MMSKIRGGEKARGGGEAIRPPHDDGSKVVESRSNFLE